MSIELTRGQRRRMKKLAKFADRATEADRLYFEHFQRRQHRIGLSHRTEIEQAGIIDGKPMTTLPGWRWFTVVRNVIPGVHLRLFTSNLERRDRSARGWRCEVFEESGNAGAAGNRGGDAQGGGGTDMMPSPYGTGRCVLGAADERDDTTPARLKGDGHDPAQAAAGSHANPKRKRPRSWRSSASLKPRGRYAPERPRPPPLSGPTRRTANVKRPRRKSICQRTTLRMNRQRPTAPHSRKLRRSWTRRKSIR